jgi:uncharacterized protein (DUF1330 family)
MLPLEKEFEYFVKNQDELVKKYGGKYIVIKNEAVIGVFDDLMVAITETSKKEKRGTFLVQKCEAGKAAYTQTFHSRVEFV